MNGEHLFSKVKIIPKNHSKSDDDIVTDDTKGTICWKVHFNVLVSLLPFLVDFLMKVALACFWVPSITKSSSLKHIIHIQDLITALLLKTRPELEQN